MAYAVAQLAAQVGGVLRGDGTAIIQTALPLSQATPSCITFLSEARQQAKLISCTAAAVLVPAGVEPQAMPTIVVADPLSAMIDVARLLTPPETKPTPGIDPKASVHSSATIPSDCSVGPFAVIEAGVVLGAGCTIHSHAVIRTHARLGDGVEVHPHAVIYQRTIVGDRCLIHAGAVVGREGFGFRFHGGKHQRIPQLGCVRLGDDVEIGANTTIDRGTFGETSIGMGTKIDNQVQIGHNCQIGEHNILVGHVGLAGSCTTGAYVQMAGKVGIADHVNIGAGAHLGAHAGVHTDIPEGGRYLGSPARPERDTKRVMVAMERLPQMRRELNEVRRRLGLDPAGDAVDDVADRKAG